LIATYSPKELVQNLPSISNISTNLEQWRVTIEQRISHLQQNVGEIQPTTQEKTTQEKTTQEKPTQEKPTQEKPTQEKPTQEKTQEETTQENKENSATTDVSKSVLISNRFQY